MPDGLLPYYIYPCNPVIFILVNYLLYLSFVTYSGTDEKAALSENKCEFQKFIKSIFICLIANRDLDAADHESEIKLKINK